MSLRKQVQVLRLSGMLFDLFIQFGDVELGARLRRELRPVVEIVEEMLKGNGSCRRILRECLKYAQIALRGRSLVKISLDHCQLVVAGNRIAADLYVAAKKFGSFGIFFVLYSQICQLQEGLGKIGIGTKRLPK